MSVNQLNECLDLIDGINYLDQAIGKGPAELAVGAQLIKPVALQSQMGQLDRMVQSYEQYAQKNNTFENASFSGAGVGGG